MVSNPTLYPCYTFNQPLQAANCGTYPQAQTLSVPAHILQVNVMSILPQQNYGGIISTPTVVPATTGDLTSPNQNSFNIL